ncbi:MAG: efflux RND transporter periplasmic adaptor subunit [Alphaproteobacteria bacterium]
MKKSHISAIIIALIVIVWIISGQFGEAAKTPPPAQSIASQTESASRVAVRVMRSQAQMKAQVLTVRGQTEAVRKAAVRAETRGRIERLPQAKGAVVKKGAVLCELAVQERAARVKEAEAIKRQRQLEYNAAKALAKKGHKSDTAVAGAQAMYDAAAAMTMQVEIELANTKVRAPFSGVVEDLPSDEGEFLQPGAVCAVLVDDSSFLVTAQVSEDNVGQLAVGGIAQAVLATGESLEGKVRFVAKTAHPATRTFLVEIEIPNATGTLREGVTATLKLPTNEVSAHRLPSSILALSDAGEIGVKIIRPGNQVEFVPISIIDEDDQGVWVRGLEASADVIVAGQDFVRSGAVVTVERGDNS